MNEPKCKKNMQMLQKEVKPEGFWQAIDIFLTKPHVVNKRLWGSKLWCRFYGNATEYSEWKAPSKITRLPWILDDKTIVEWKEAILNEVQLKECDKNDSLIEGLVVELLPKSICSYQIVQLVLLDRRQNTVYFYNLSRDGLDKLCPTFSFNIQLIHNDIKLNAVCETSNNSYQWLANTLIPHLIKWSIESTIDQKQTICKDSLTLVQQNQYHAKYNELKNKYGKEMVKVWPECTDPTKFVYEDVAIATYLLLLWDEYDPGKAQAFVDLGCGNGLLVYILSKEGHSGVGYDVRKRNIWDMYPEVQLEEKTIVPSDKSLFPDTDWIIGNHSDELTPWIPVITAKSSYKCNFFLLPCCSYNFDGTKYQRRNSNKSQYMDYLEYIRDMCVECGFKVGVDRLKIPSTKRICLVSRGRLYDRNEYIKFCDKISHIISKDTENDTDNSSWIKSFKPRDPVERVRNCTQIDKNLINSIVKCIVDYLLQNIDIHATWSAGKLVDIGDLIQLISKEDLKQLKAECGGLQTLLKNNHNIFKVQSGKVQLRYPKSIDEVNKNSDKIYNLKVKQKPCWFYNNHPQGCPLLSEQCSFKHEK